MTESPPCFVRAGVRVRERRRGRSMISATSSNAAWNTCAAYGVTSANDMPLSTDISNRASNVPPTGSRPPVRWPPPSSTAVTTVTTVSLIPIPAVGSPVLSCEVLISPSSAAAGPDTTNRAMFQCGSPDPSNRCAAGNVPTARLRRPIADLDIRAATSAIAAKIRVVQHPEPLTCTNVK